MTKDKLHRYLKAFKALVERAQDVDFAKSRLFREMRANYTGETGDAEFCECLKASFKMTAAMATEALCRVHAACIVPDAETWNKVGGFVAIRALDGMPRVDQVAVIEEAKLNGRAIRTVIKDRGLGPKPATPALPRASACNDARDLAAYIIAQANGTPLPAAVRAIVDRYVTTPIARETTTPAQRAEARRVLFNGRAAPVSAAAVAG